MKGKSGRPTPLDDITSAQWELFEKAVSLGVPLRFAAVQLGVVWETANKWLDRGRQDLAEKHDSPYAWFFLQFEAWRSDWVIDCAEEIQASESGHKGRQWMLERVMRKHFGAKLDIESTNETSVTITKFTPEQLTDLEYLDDE